MLALPSCSGASGLAHVDGFICESGGDVAWVHG